MKKIGKVFGMIMMISSLVLPVLHESMGAEVKAKFDVSKMGDMSDFDPNNPMKLTGETIKIAVVAPYSGPASVSGELYYLSTLWPAHDINKRGGVLVDGK